MIDTLSATLLPLFHQAISARVFPGAAMAVISKSGTVQKTEFCCYGYTDYQKTHRVTLDTVYDLASLTKPLATTLAIFSLIKEKKISLGETLSSLLECEAPADKKTITLTHLLNHSSGLAAYQDFHPLLMKMPRQERTAWLRQEILRLPLRGPSGARQCYSDLGFILLGMVVQIKAKVSLDDFVRERIIAPLALEKKIFFNRNGLSAADPVYAPTEECPWRNKALQGEVHDDNAWAMGGVAGHAGLFGSIQGVAGIVGYLLDAVKGRAQHIYLDSDDIKKAVQRQSSVGTWGLGFDSRSEKGSSSGRYLSPASFGHLGYTGTSFWVDPVQDMAIILLSNRVHPRRDNEQIKGFRPVFHDGVMKFFAGR